MEWFRVYTEARRDQKLRTLTAEQHRVWFNLLCFAAEQDDHRGLITGYDEELLAVEVANANLDLLRATLDLLQKLRIVSAAGGDIAFLKFTERQYGKPSNRPERVAERVRRHRVREGALQSVTGVTAPQEGVTGSVRGAKNGTLTPADGAVGNALYKGSNAAVTPCNDTDTDTDTDIHTLTGVAPDKPDAPPTPIELPIRAVPKPPKPKPPGHPAVSGYRRLAGGNPKEAVRALIADAVPADNADALERWQQAVSAWVTRGYNVANVAAMLDWYRDGIPPPNKPANPRAPPTTPASLNGPYHQPQSQQRQPLPANLPNLGELTRLKPQDFEQYQREREAARAKTVKPKGDT